MSKTIEEIKDEYAKELDNGAFKSWADFRYYNEIEDRDLVIVAQRYTQSQTQDLQDWKESASKVFKNLDLQAIGKTLGIGLGEDVSTNVLPKINQLQEQNAELVEAVWYLYNFSKGMHFHKGSKTDKEIAELLTKYNHLKSNTNETDKI